jgi:glyoxylase-like metal-dependent hydrolase (beta-lactamase superfamily II)
MNAPTIPSLELPFAAPPAPGETIRVAPGIRWLRMPLPFALDHVNLWLCDDDARVAIVDTGLADDATRREWHLHFERAIAQRRVDAIVATHYHPDHVGNAAWLAEHFGVPVTMTYAELLHARGVQRDDAPMGVAAYAAFFATHGLAPADVDALVARGNAYRRVVPALPSTFLRIVDGDEIDLAGTRFRVIVGHGHSPEHAALYAATPGVLIAGDMLLPRISTNVGVTPGEPDADPVARFLGSLARFEQLPPDTLVLPSHGLPFRGIALRVAALRAHHAARLAELEAFVRASPRPVSAADALPVLFRRALDLQQRFFAMGEAIAHLNHLWRHRRLARVVDAAAIRFEAPS